MTSILLTGPAIEPISLAETKTFLRVEHDDEDQLITALIAGARSHIEAQMQTALITQDWRMVLDAWPRRGHIIIRPGPLKALNTARVFDCNGASYTIDSQAIAPDFGASTLAFVPWAVPAPGLRSQFRCRAQRKDPASNIESFKRHDRHYRYGGRGGVCGRR